MRGCLSVLMIGGLFLVAIVWFGGPPLAETVVEASLTGTGFEADELDVTVRADPPLALALGRADQVEIEATGVRWMNLRAGSMTLRLDGVDLLERTATTADGQFDDVELDVAGGVPALVAITVAGPADGARTTVAIDGPTVSRIALAAFEQEFGTRPDSAELVAPDVIRIRGGGAELSGRLLVAGDGALTVVSGLGTLRLVEPAASTPFTLSGASATAGGLELTGTMDIDSLLR